MANAEFLKRAGVSSRSSSTSETEEAADEMTSSSEVPRADLIELEDVTLKLYATSVSSLSGFKICLTTRLEPGKARSISASELVRTAMKFFSNINLLRVL